MVLAGSAMVFFAFGYAAMYAMEQFIGIMNDTTARIVKPFVLDRGLPELHDELLGPIITN